MFGPFEPQIQNNVICSGKQKGFLSIVFAELRVHAGAAVGFDAVHS